MGGGGGGFARLVCRVLRERLPPAIDIFAGLMFDQVNNVVDEFRRDWDLGKEDVEELVGSDRGAGRSGIFRDRVAGFVGVPATGSIQSCLTLL